MLTLDAPPAAEPGALPAPLLRPAAPAACLDAGGGAHAWWSMFYVYAPIFAVTSGMGAETGGVIVSVGTGVDLAGAAMGLGRPPLRAAPPAGCGYAGAGVLTVCAAPRVPRALAGRDDCWCWRHWERRRSTAPATCCSCARCAPMSGSEMTTVFVSFRDVAQLGRPSSSRSCCRCSPCHRCSSPAAS